MDHKIGKKAVVSPKAPSADGIILRFESQISRNRKKFDN